MMSTAATPTGTLRGRVLPNGGSVFAGIPFAVPPVGRRRFLPPEPNGSWRDVHDATTFRAAPPQILPPPYSQLGIETSEDCLYLNVWTPSIERRHPVLVWIHGGGFDVGYAAPPGSNPEGLMRRADVVVASIAYRVGALGFLQFEEGGANRGLLDQILGLRWIRENIGSLGGDSTNITVFGNSAGAFSIGALLAMPEADGLFDRAILQSGTTHVRDPEHAVTLTHAFFDAIRIRDSSELDHVPLDRILNAQHAVIDTDIGRRFRTAGRSWGPVLDGLTIPRHPHDAVAAGSAKRIPLLVGANRDETQLWELADADNYAPASLDELAIEIGEAIGPSLADDLVEHYQALEPGASAARLRTRFLSDWIFRVRAARFAHAQVTAGGYAWTYLFDMSSSEYGAHHAAEMAYVFDRLGEEQFAPFSPPETAATKAVRDDMIDIWRRFAATGEAPWPSFDEARTTRVLGESTVQTIAEPSQEVWRIMRDVG